MHICPKPPHLPLFSCHKCCCLVRPCRRCNGVQELLCCGLWGAQAAEAEALKDGCHDDADVLLATACTTDSKHYLGSRHPLTRCSTATNTAWRLSRQPSDTSFLCSRCRLTLLLKLDLRINQRAIDRVHGPCTPWANCINAPKSPNGDISCHVMYHVMYCTLTCFLEARMLLMAQSPGDPWALS